MTAIRPLHPSDASSLYALSREPSPLLCDLVELGDDLDSFRAYTGTPANDHYRLVAIQDDDMVGLGVLERSTNARMAHLGRLRLLASPAALENEPGIQLLSALIDLADNWLNLRRLEAEAPDGVPELGALLLRCGFEVEGAMAKSIGPGPVFDNETAYARLRGFEDRILQKRVPTDSPRSATDRLAHDELIVRPMAATDIDDLYAVFRAPENCRTTLQLPSQELWLTRQRVLEPPAGMIRLVAESHGRVIGMISLNRRKRICRSHIAGIGMMIHPEFWDQGVGSCLMEHILDVASRQMGLSRIELQVHSDNPAGIRLYEKFGFVVEGTKLFHSFGAGGWVDAHFMARTIEQKP